MRDDLDRIFEPDTIAIVGASTDPTKRGHQIMGALEASGFRGEVWPVNPRGGEIRGRPVLRSVEELPDGVDLAVLCTPAGTAPDLVRGLGRRGVAGALVLAVGFGETGAEGAALAEELRRAGREAGVRILGPNTSGLLHPRHGLNLVGVRGVRAGGLGVLVQSGNVALALMTEVTERSWDGLSIYLGVGNQIDLGFAEALEYLGRDPGTHAVIGYLEGSEGARSVLAAAARTTRRTPIVAIKAGRTEAGSEAARSHTGSVAGPYDRFSAGLRQAGVIEVRRTDELLHVAETVGRQPPCAPDLGVAVLSDGGGHGTLVSDTLSETGVRLARLDPATRQALRDLLGPNASVRNPIDLAGASDAAPEVFGTVLDLLARDPGVGAALVVGLFGGYGMRFAASLTEGELDAAHAMVASARAHGIGLVVHSMYAAHRSEPLAVLGGAGVPVVGSLEVACRCVGALQERGRMLTRPPWALAREAGPARPDAPDEAGLARALTEPEARDRLARAGASFPESRTARTEGEAAAAVAALGTACALKLVSAAITHKTEADGVRLGVAGDEAARVAFRSIIESARSWGTARGFEPEPPAVLVTPMLDPPRAELVIGCIRDPELGPVLTVGAGGVHVEALADVAHRVLPVTDEDIIDAIAELQVDAVLRSPRQGPPVSLAPVVAVAQAVASALEADPTVLEVEINPLFVYGERAVPVDARMIVSGASTRSG